ncbi:MAG: thioredoxin family protein [Acidobacteriota bacterium]|nr:thioredoxin family protein [Acidobacteriota bacterium]
MNLSKLKNCLEVTTNLAVVLVSLVVLYTCAWAYFSGTSKPRPEAGLRRGSTIVTPPGLNSGGSPQILLVAMTTGCQFCTDSIPFYNQMKAQQSNIKGTRIVAVFPDSKDEVEKYVRQRQLNIESVAEVDFRLLGIPATPSLILLDGNGKVLDFWIGKLSGEDERQAVNAVSAGT